MSTTTTTLPTTTPSITILMSAYGGWNYDKTDASMVRVTFQGPDADARCAAWVASHGHLVIEPETGDDGFPAIPVGFDATMGALFPLCEHQMSASLCCGPDHFPTADQEREWGW